jgi:hypothetical protein
LEEFELFPERLLLPLLLPPEKTKALKELTFKALRDLVVPRTNLYAISLIKQHNTFKANHEWIIELFNQNLNKMGLPVFISQNTELLKQNVTVNANLELKESLVKKIQRDIKISSRLNRNIGHINYDWQYVFYAFLKDLLVESQQEHPYNQKGVNKIFIKDVEDKNWDELVNLAQEINKWYRMNT